MGISKRNQASLFGLSEIITKYHYPVMVGDFFETLTQKILRPTKIVSNGIPKGSHSADLISDKTLFEVKACGNKNKHFVFRTQQWEFYKDFDLVFPDIDIFYCFYNYDLPELLSKFETQDAIYEGLAQSIKSLIVMDHKMFSSLVDSLGAFDKKYLFGDNWSIKIPTNKLKDCNSQFCFIERSIRMNLEGLPIKPFIIQGMFSVEFLKDKAMCFLRNDDKKNKAVVNWNPPKYSQVVQNKQKSSEILEDLPF